MGSQRGKRVTQKGQALDLVLIYLELSVKTGRSQRLLSGMCGETEQRCRQKFDVKDNIFTRTSTSLQFRGENPNLIN